MKTLRTVTEVREEFSKRGLSIAEWARANNFSVALVYRVLSESKRRATRGQSHDIAVALNLKEGVERDLSNLPFSLKKCGTTIKEE